MTACSIKTLQLITGDREIPPRPHSMIFSDLDIHCWAFLQPPCKVSCRMLLKRQSIPIRLPIIYGGKHVFMVIYFMTDAYSSLFICESICWGNVKAMSEVSHLFGLDLPLVYYFRLHDLHVYRKTEKVKDKKQSPFILGCELILGLETDK